MLAQRRADFALTATSLSALPSTSIVISPMPIIDEISAEARLDSRIMMFEESDISVAMRMAVLEFILAQRDRGTRGVG